MSENFWPGKYGYVKYEYTGKHVSYYCSMYMWLFKDKCYTGKLLGEYPLYAGYGLKICKNLIMLTH